ncbi:MAG: ABC transporter permease [Chloroflexota bacterium]
MNRLLLPATLLVMLLVIWELVVWLLAVPKWIVPPPSAIGQAFWETRGLLAPHVGQTMLEVAIGIGVAISTGIAVAAILDFSPWLRRAIYPLLVISQTIPILALAPLLIIWFGFGIVPKVIVVTLFCFFPIAINTTDGLAAAEPELIDLFRSMGATWWQIWLKVRLPAALPYFFSGLKIAATYSVVGAIVGEWVGAKQGLGIYLLRSSAAFKTAQVFTAIVITSLLSILLFLAVFGIERWAMPWYFEKRRE